MLTREEHEALIARRKDEEGVALDPRLELAQQYGNQAMARLLARDPAAPAVDEPLKTGIPPWIQSIYVTAGVLMAHEANEMLNKAGVWGVEKFNKCFVLRAGPDRGPPRPLLQGRAAGRRCSTGTRRTRRSRPPTRRAPSRSSPATGRCATSSTATAPSCC